MSTTKTCTIIGSDKGGVGKSLLSQLIVMAYDQGKRPLTVIEVDNQRKLTATLRNRVNLSLDAGPSIAAAAKSRLAGESFLNEAYAAWTERDSLTDLGANVTTLLMEWFQVNEAYELAAEDDVHFRFVAVATPDDQAIRSASVAVESARRSLGADAEVFVVLNDLSQGTGFRPYENTQDWRHLNSLRHTHGAQFIEVPLCDSVVLEYAKALGFTIQDVFQDRDGALDRIQQQAGLDRLTARVHVRKLTAWLRQLQTSMMPLFVPYGYQQAYDVAAE